MDNFGIVPLHTPKTPTIDWNQLYFTAESDNTVSSNKFATAKIVSINSELLRIANLQAVVSTIMKYPDWPYRPNKRAENFLNKMEKTFFLSGPTALRESIEKLDDGSYRIVLDMVEGEDYTIKALELYRKYDGSYFHQIGSPKSVKKTYSLIKDTIEC